MTSLPDNFPMPCASADNATMGKTLTFVHAPELRYDQNYGTLFPPVWAYTLAAHVPSDWSTKIVDCTFEAINDLNPSRVFAFSGINQDLDSVLDIFKKLKQMYPTSIFIVGGPMTWSFQQEDNLHLLQDFDHIFLLDGEETLPLFLRNLSDSTLPDLPKIYSSNRFSLNNAKTIRSDLFQANASHYYGTIIEVSRGCPFLCEFCDIRVLPGNNRSHNKPVPLIIEELNSCWELGITQFQFACDNFIGDLTWARECVDAIIDWKNRVNADISIFTWLTLNLYKATDLMEKMRRAGFSILFIGLESVNENSLLETAKVQNRNKLYTAVTTIQSYGFIIAPGFIFGFDSDTNDMFKDTLDFIENAGLIGGDPSFLMALPGTPLHKRIKTSGRLIEKINKPTNREKIATNIRYLQKVDVLVDGFLYFLKVYNHPNYQLRRYKRHLELVIQGNNYVDTKDVGYGSPLRYLKLQFRDSTNRRFLIGRLSFLVRHPQNLVAVLRAWLLTKRYSRAHPGLSIHFNYWIYVWTNIYMKYKHIRKTDFELSSVGENFDFEQLTTENVIDEGRDTISVSEGKKISHQERYTNAALRKIRNQYQEI